MTIVQIIEHFDGKQLNKFNQCVGLNFSSTKDCIKILIRLRKLLSVTTIEKINQIAKTVAKEKQSNVKYKNKNCQQSPIASNVVEIFFADWEVI